MKFVFNPTTGKLDYVLANAGELPITDAGTYYSSTSVEAALQEIGAANYLPTTDIVGTLGQVAKFTGTNSLGDAALIPPATNILTLTNAAVSTLALNITSAKTLTLTAADNYTLTIPATGTAALGTGTANYVGYWSGTNTLTGATTFTYNPSATPNLLLTAANAAHVPLRIQAAVSQTADTFRITRSDGTTVTCGADERGILFSNGGTTISNFFAGNNAGNIATSGSNDFGLGDSSLLSVTNGSYNTAVGNNSLRNALGASYNLALGQNACYSLQNGDSNMAIGVNALQMGTAYTRCSAVGSAALLNSNANDNTAIGYSAGRLVTSGASCVFIGSYSGYRQTTTSNLLIIDNQLRADAATELTNAILYGVMAATPASQTLRINAVETVAVDTTTTNAALNVLDLRSYVSTASTGFAAGGGVSQSFSAETATDGTFQTQALIASTWVDATNATRKANLTLSAYDTAIRNGLTIAATGSDVTLLAYGKLAFTQTDLNEYIDSLGDGYMDYRATTAHRFGDGTNYLNITGSGLTSFVGTAGLYAGHMYTNTLITVTISDNNPTEIGDTWTTGEVNGVSFGSAHYLDVGANGVGKYLVVWGADVAQNTPSAAIVLEIGIMVNGTAQVQGKVKRNVANSTDIGAVASTAILDLAANAQVSLYVANLTNTTDIDVDNANVTITQIIGT